MLIHVSQKTYDIPSGENKTLFELVSALTGVTLHTPCGGHGKCGKCLCAVLGDSTVTPAESAFLDGVDCAAELERCGVPAEKRASAHLRYLCLCPADGITDVYLPSAAELTGAVFSETVAAASPVVTAKNITLTMPTLENPVDTLGNLRSVLGDDADIPFSAVCRVSKELAQGVTDFTALVCGSRVIDVVTETRPSAYAFLAVDIGTTTVALSLRDMQTGAELAGDVFGNPQRSFGGDVISRMSHASAGEAENLKNSIRTAIAEHANALCKRAGIDKDGILCTSIAGNSVMEHLYAGLDTAPIAVSPFFMQTKFGWEIRANDALCGAADFMNPDGLVYLAPLAASYVGGDITVGLAYILEKHPEIKGKNALFLDLGTNGELCVIADGKYYFAATAAGPALEGAEIEMGMSATPGAVYKVKANAEKGGFDVSVVGYDAVVGDGEATGICGSGIIDAAAAAVRAGLIAPTGSICTDFDELEDYADMFDDAEPREYDEALFEALSGCADEDDDCVYFTENVKLTWKDIRAVQTAKAAISAGIEVLLRTAGITADDLDAVYLAGSFGGGIDVTSAAEIGILPKTCVQRGIVQAAGNTSLAGAAAYLFDEKVRENLREIMANARYTELSSDKGFTDAFVGGMMF